MVEKYRNGQNCNRHLYNGPIESLNRKVKVLKRLSGVFRNFEYFKNRFLYATKNSPILNGVCEYTLVQYFEDEDFKQSSAYAELHHYYCP